MFLCLRVNLDYVPWDAALAEEFGHGEPAVVIRLLELARKRGLKLHFFASGRSLRAFPSIGDSVLNDGHDLDWLGADTAGFAEALPLFRKLGITPQKEFEFAGPRSDLDATRAGSKARAWAESVRSYLSEASSQGQHVTLVVHPQVLGKIDPHLGIFKELVESALSMGFKIRTLREGLDAG